MTTMPTELVEGIKQLSTLLQQYEQQGHEPVVRQNRYISWSGLIVAVFFAIMYLFNIFAGSNKELKVTVANHETRITVIENKVETNKEAIKENKENIKDTKIIFKK